MTKDELFDPYVIIIVLNVAMKLDGLIDWPWMLVVWPVLLYCLLAALGFVILWFKGMKEEFKGEENGSNGNKSR